MDAKLAEDRNLSTPPPPIDADPELPGYSARTQGSSAASDLVEHKYQLEDLKGREWLWLTVKSRSPSVKQLPLFYEKDTIEGTVEVDFDKTDGAKAVVIAVTAGVTAVGQDEVGFLDIRHELWNAKTSSSKRAGKQSWPFSLTLPSDAVVPDGSKSKQPAKVYPLPPSFSERASPAYVDYKLIVTIKKGSFRVKQTLGTSIVYVPLRRAAVPSPLRQLAYAEGTPVIGPDGDPDGWKVLPSVKITGTVFDTRQVEVECTLAVATPLSYALGNPIPLSLTIKCSDEQALDLLAKPSAARVQLARVRLVGSHATQDDVTSGRSNNSFQERFGGAIFWPSNEGAPQPGVRVLQGELEVKRSLRLDFVFPRFSLRYVLVLLNFKTPGFAPASGAGAADDPLLLEPVSIASLNAPGVTPRSSHADPPAYARSGEGDYNTTVGFLENGNQRFLHHHGFQ